jgi:hypothetical protein
VRDLQKKTVQFFLDLQKVPEFQSQDNLTRLHETTAPLLIQLQQDVQDDNITLIKNIWRTVLQLQVNVPVQSYYGYYFITSSVPEYTKKCREFLLETYDISNPLFAVYLAEFYFEIKDDAIKVARFKELFNFLFSPTSANQDEYFKFIILYCAAMTGSIRIDAIEQVEELFCVTLLFQKSAEITNFGNNASVIAVQKEKATILQLKRNPKFLSERTNSEQIRDLILPCLTHALSRNILPIETLELTENFFTQTASIHEDAIPSLLKPLIEALINNATLQSIDIACTETNGLDSKKLSKLTTAITDRNLVIINNPNDNVSTSQKLTQEDLVVIFLGDEPQIKSIQQWKKDNVELIEESVFKPVRTTITPKN